jgi:RimJ/RimL family protein N-acetyltransferase
MGLPEIETERLVLRQFTPADLDVYAERIFADPEGIEVFWRALAKTRLR